MVNVKLSTLLKDKQVRFSYYRDNSLWYELPVDESVGLPGNKLVFPVPISDAGSATFLAEDKAILFMRYVRKYLDSIQEASDGQSEETAF